jgi:signal transduction histidine kinase
LLLEDETDDRKKYSLFAILHNSERLQKLASDILDIARIESSTFRLNKKSLNLNSAISNIVKDYVKRQKQRKARDITGLISNTNGGNHNNKNKDTKAMQTKLVFQSKVKEGEDIVVEADEERLTEVIDNILDNAFKFTDSYGRVRVSLEKKQEEQGQQHAIITIKDTGTGIDPEILPRLFTKFATKSHKGTGLGLYISTNIVEAHGGKLYAINNSGGKGATFTITLPLFDKKQKQE